MFRTLIPTLVFIGAMHSAIVHAQCPTGQHEVSVEGVEGAFCAQVPVCMGYDESGHCPMAQSGLEYGSYCGIVASGVYGCKPHSTQTMVPAMTPEPTAATPMPSPTAPMGCGLNETEVSVEGVNQIFCVSGSVCTGEVYTGACPEAQAGLPWGSYCGIVSSGVYGCKPHPEPTAATSDPVDTPPATVDEDNSQVVDCAGHPGGEIPVSVEGAGTYCAREPVCAGVNSGNCPGAESGLTVPARCVVISTGVYGCSIWS